MADAILAQSGIYQIRNTVNGKVYVGSSSNLSARWRSHRCTLNKKTHVNIRLQRAWMKYGEDLFEFVVVEYVENVNNLILREQHWIDSLLSWSQDTGYNICRVAGSTRGVIRTPETRAKLSAKAMFRSPSPETRAKLSAATKGRKKCPESVAKSSASRTGRKSSLAQIERMRVAQTGKRISDATKAKLSEVVKQQWASGKRTPNSIFVVGRKMAPEVVAKVAAAHKGMKRSHEAKAKMSDYAKNRPADHIAKMVASLTGRKLSAEAIEKREATRRANGSHIPSAETRKKRSDSMKGRKKTPEHIANGIAARAANKIARITASAT
jgi:group I intron endonuclease